MSESRYNPDNEDLARKTSQLEEVLISARDVLLQFVVSLPAPKQVLMAQAAILPFLKNIDVLDEVENCFLSQENILRSRQ